MRALLPALLLAAGLSACDSGRDAARVPAAADATPATPATRDAPPPPAAAGQPAGIPAAFRGRYAADATACDTPGDPSRLELTADAIHFHESSGPVLDVATTGDGIAIGTRLTGEGETRRATYRFALRGGVLTDLDGGMERVRCD